MSSPTHLPTASSLFNSIGKAYQIAFANIPGQARSLQWINSNTTSTPNSSKILDIGCGTGIPACKLLSEAGRTVTGIDISEVMIRTAREQVPTATFVQAGWQDWKPEEDELYDAIVVYFSIIADVSRQDIRDFFGRAYEWLRRGGCFVFATVPIAGEKSGVRFLGREAIVSGLDVDENLEAIKAAGFEVERHEVDMFKPRGQEAGLCDDEDASEEPHLFVYARKV